MASTSDDHRRRHHRRNRHTWVASTVFDVDKDVIPPATCIDLTLDVSDDDITDLTHGHSLTVADSAVEVLSPENIIGPVRARRRNGRRGRRSTRARQDFLEPVVHASSSRVHVLSDDSDSDSLPELPFEFIPPSMTDIDGTMQSPEGVHISCPICLEDTKQIRRTGRQIISTICGHIFCDTCIGEAISLQHACPTCRKKLTRRNIHPLFI